MLTLNISRLVMRPLHVRINRRVQRRYNSTEKLKQSYYCQAIEFPIAYKTLSQNFDAIADQNPDHECLVFKGKDRYNRFIGSIKMFEYSIRRTEKIYL